MATPPKAGSTPAKTAAPGKKPPPGKKGGKVLTSFVSTLLVVVGAITLLPSTIVIVVGLLPTAVAVFVDSSRERLAGLTIGCMNVAGVLLPLMMLWHQGHSVENALHILMEPFMLLSMYGGAAIGLLLYVNTPLMVSGLLRKQASFRLKAIDRQRNDLREEWGAEIETEAK